MKGLDFQVHTQFVIGVRRRWVRECGIWVEWEGGCEAVRISLGVLAPVRLMWFSTSLIFLFLLMELYVFRLSESS